MRVLINEIDDLSQGERAILTYHSVVNIINVVAGELQILRIDLANLDKTSLIQEELEKIICRMFLLPSRIRSGHLVSSEIVGWCLGTKNQTLDFLAKHRKVLFGELGKEYFERLETNLLSIFGVMDLRLRETQERTNTYQWTKYQIDHLIAQVQDVLKAVEINAGGKYRIKFQRENQINSDDYLVELQIVSIDGSEIWLPDVLSDVFRDLLMNSRKYTQIGGNIAGTIFDDGDQITLLIEDNGIGIPQNEITKVCNFGHRAQNALQHKTNGDGFGLTKAYVCCQEFGGKMWIDSELGQGTTIQIEIPSYQGQK